MKFHNDSLFLEHTKRHIENVVFLGIALFNTIEKSETLKQELQINNNDINNLKPHLIRMLKNHDISKVSTEQSFLDKYNLKEPNYKMLFKFAGVSLNDDERDFIKQLNRIDSIETERLYNHFDLSFEQQKLFKFIEHTSDLVERGCNPVSEIEFGRKMKLASEFNSHLRSPMVGHLVTSLENYYFEHLYEKQQQFIKDNFQIKNNDENVIDFLKKKEAKNLAQHQQENKSIKIKTNSNTTKLNIY